MAIDKKKAATLRLISLFTKSDESCLPNVQKSNLEYWRSQHKISSFMIIKMLSCHLYVKDIHTQWFSSLFIVLQEANQVWILEAQRYNVICPQSIKKSVPLLFRWIWIPHSAGIFQTPRNQWLLWAHWTLSHHVAQSGSRRHRAGNTDVCGRHPDTTATGRTNRHDFIFAKISIL